MIRYSIIDEATIAPRRMTRCTPRLVLDTGGQRIKLSVPKREMIPVGLHSGDVVDVQGQQNGDQITAARLSIQDAPQQSACSTVGPQNIAVILATFPGTAPPLPSSTVYDLFFGTNGRSLDGFWREASYGKANATGKLFGWYTLDKAYGCDDFDALRSAVIRAADADVDFKNYSRIAVVFPSMNCPFAGASTVGCETLNSPGDGSFDASFTWLPAPFLEPRDFGAAIVTHELGHGLGLDHSHSRLFSNEPLGPMGNLGTIVEQGDVFSDEGNNSNAIHYVAPHKALLGWLTPQTIESNGTFSLLPYESAGGNALKVRRGTGNNAFLWLEYRQPIGGYDTVLPPQGFSGAVIHYADALKPARATHLVDFNPQTTTMDDAALSAGRSWKDPYTDLSLAISNATPNSLTVTASYGSGPPTPPIVTGQVIITPSSVQVKGTTPIRFTANHNEFTWSTNHNVGSLVPDGPNSAIYTPSATGKPGWVITITATSKAVPSLSASATVTY